MTNHFDHLLALVESEMAADAPATPQEIIKHDIAQRLAWVASELDGLIALSRDFDAPEIQEAICAEEISFFAVLFRAQLLCSFIESQRPQGLRLVKGSGR